MEEAGRCLAAQLHVKANSDHCRAFKRWTSIFSAIRFFHWLLCEEQAVLRQPRECKNIGCLNNTGLNLSQAWENLGFYNYGWNSLWQNIKATSIPRLKVTKVVNLSVFIAWYRIRKWLPWKECTEKILRGLAIFKPLVSAECESHVHYLICKTATILPSEDSHTYPVFHIAARTSVCGSSSGFWEYESHSWWDFPLWPKA